jgi:transglutaminase-like putative cysteine protease
MGLVVSSAASPPSGVPPEGSAERFFQWSLYLMLVTGFCALMGTGKLDPPSLALMILAILLRGYALLMRRKLLLPERWSTYLTLLYFPFYAADYFYISQSFVFATAHLVLFLVVMSIFSVRRDRHLMWLAVLSFGMVLFAVVLTVDTLFLLTFALFILAAMATFVSLEMRRSERDLLAAPVASRHAPAFYRSLAAVSAMLGALTLAGAGLIFFILPRWNSVGYLRNLGVQSSLSTGFSQDVRLGGIGRIQQSSAVVMHVQVVDGKLPPDAKWRGLSLANFDGQRWWNGQDVLTARSLINSSLDLRQAWTPVASKHTPIRYLPTLRYRVIMEPIGLNLFFLAPVPLRLGGNYRWVQTAEDGSVSSVSSHFVADTDNAPNVGVYTAEADTRNPELLVRNSNSRDYPARVLQLYLPLPHLDPRVAGLARRITAPADSNYARARAIESYLKNTFGYTLDLPTAPVADPVSHFLFERRKGHCEYFASSMTVMLRTLGIPARVVNGFRAGTFNDLSGSYIVREKDAHSWVEAYFPEYGWVAFDPTPAGPAAPALNGWERLGLYLDAAREMWREWIVNYDFSHQVRLSNQISNTTTNAKARLRIWLRRRYWQIVIRTSKWQRRLQQMSPAAMTLSCLLLAVLLALPFAPRAWRVWQGTRLRKNPARAPKYAASFWYLRMLKRLARRGLRKTPAQTPEEFASSIPDPRVRQDVVVFTEHYERARFDESVEDAKRLEGLYQAIAGKS